MKDTLNVAIIQFSPIWKEVQLNLKTIDFLLQNIDVQIDLVLLPEMATTGFVTSDLSFIRNHIEHTYHSLKSMAEKYNTTIGGSILSEEKEIIYNRFFLINSTNTDFYDKKHLFLYAEEHKEISPGTYTRLPIFTLDGWKIAPSICYDLRFPVWLRNTTSYDLLINVANWPARRDKHWQALLQARAIENQCYVIGVNRIGKDGNEIEYIGNSLAYRYDGELLLNCYKEEGVYIVQLNKKKLINYRTDYPFLLDRDEFVMS